MSYSQLSCDVIARYLLRKDSDVTYIDIGCLYPVKESNTYLFYRKGGRGLCIDPNPTVKTVFETERPRDIFVEAAVGPETGRLDYYMHANPVYNTVSPDQARNVARKAARGLRKCALLEVRSIPVLPLGEIVSRAGFAEQAAELDFLSIDAEGFEQAIVTSTDFSAIRPKLVCLELILDPSHPINIYETELARILGPLGYDVVAFTGHDVFFRRRAGA